MSCERNAMVIDTVGLGKFNQATPGFSYLFTRDR